LIDAQPCAPIISPGQTKSHYAPRTPLRLDVTRPQAGEALLAFGPDAPAFAGPTINLSPRGDLNEAAMQFFAGLRSLDEMGARAIAVMPIPDHGLGEAINDRLRRAAAAGVSSPIVADMHSR
jgi:L-threonylcarbamoyladenylate synthase